MAAEAVGVEQWSLRPVARQLLPQVGEQAWFARQPQRQLLVRRQALGDQFGEPDRAQQAARDSAREGGTGACKHRQARPQGIARRGVRIAWKRVEKKVRQTLAPQMLGMGQARSEHEPGW